MSTDPLSEPVRHADDDLPARLAAIDHRLHQISTQLDPLGQLLCQLDETRAKLDTLIRSLSSARPIVAGTTCELPDCEERAP
ncbi:MAG: hypothetical protein ACRDRA_13065 [Pseudonocardiaceae bacterium]